MKLSVSKRPNQSSAKLNLRTTLSQISIFTLSGYLCELLLLIRGFLLAQILGPAIFGLWVQMRLVIMGSQYGSIGANDTMVREVPFLEAKGEHKFAHSIKVCAAKINLMSTVVLTALIVLIFSIKGNHLEPNLRLAWLLFALIFPVSELFWFAKARMRAEKRFVQLSMVNLMIASFTAVFGIISAYYYGIIGFLIVMFVVNGLALAATLSKWPQRRPSVSKLGHQAAQFSTLVKAGFPIMFSRFLLAVFYNIDLLVIWLVFTKSDLGIYSVAKYVTTAIMLIPAAVSSVLYPKIMETYGAFGKTKELRKYLIQPTFFLGAAACFLCGILFLSLHLPINWLLSDYVLSIIPGKILLLACFFGVISYMPTIILISVKKEYLLMQVTMAAILVGVITDVILIKLGYGLTGVALGTALTILIYSLFTIVSATRLLKFSPKHQILLITHTCLPYLIALVFLGSINYILPIQNFNLITDFIHTLIRCIIFFVAMSCLLYIMHFYWYKLLRQITDS